MCIKLETGLGLFQSEEMQHVFGQVICFLLSSPFLVRANLQLNIEFLLGYWMNWIRV